MNLSSIYSSLPTTKSKQKGWTNTKKASVVNDFFSYSMEPQVAQNSVLKVQIRLTKSAQNTILVVDETDEVSNRCSQNHIYGKATLTRFEEFFEEYKGVPR
ncbi:hypothetical protein [Streptococcus pneumoniae]|uniref:hypothetical protein n=1 Tax=Streptococcus pneumoniae TaxID=1313 RepID=UPI000710A1F9|nr:hypothetical protein [Streptococcus pneumoniae]